MVRNSPFGAGPVRTPVTRQRAAGSLPLTRRPEGKHLDVVQRYLDFVVGSDGARRKRGIRDAEGQARQELTETVDNQNPAVPSQVQDVMTRDVIWVPGTASFKEIVTALIGHHVAALPVLDSRGVVIGIVSESDLLAKAAGGQLVISHGQRQAEARGRLRGTTAKDLMTTPVITTTPDSPIAEAARNAAHRRVRRLPVVDARGRLVGIVSRGDLLRTFLRPDKEIEQHIRHQVIRARMGIDPTAVTVAVRDGVVSLTGSVESQPVMETLIGQVSQVGGVVGVRNDLAVRV